MTKTAIRAAQLAKTQSDLADAADEVETLSTQFEDALGARTPDEAGPLAVFWGLAETMNDFKERVQRGRDDVEALTQEITEWRTGIEPFFAATQLYASLEECEGALGEILDAFEDLPEIALPSDAELADAEDNPEARSDLLTRLQAECEALADKLTAVTGQLEGVEFPSARG
jgi:chromosome segregation ATPase